MENFERKMIKIAEEVATSHFRTLCPVWIENFGHENEFAFVNQIKSHLKSFYKQIVDETVVKNQELKQFIASKLTQRGNVVKQYLNFAFADRLKEKRELEACLGIAATPDVNAEGSLFAYLKQLKVVVAELRTRARTQDEKVRKNKGLIAQNLINSVF